MQDLSKRTDRLGTLFDEPRPLDKFITEVLTLLNITQQEFGEVTGLTQASISRIVRRKTTSPSYGTLDKIRQALIGEYGVSPERATTDYFLACRALLEPRPADTVDPRFAEIDAWLNTQPNSVQENFWDIVNAFKRTVNDTSQS